MTVVIDLVYGCLIVSLAFLSWMDIRTFKISNRGVITVAVLSTSMVVLVGRWSWAGITVALLTSAAFIALYSIRWIGAGDAKLMMALSVLFLPMAPLAVLLGSMTLAADLFAGGILSALIFFRKNQAAPLALACAGAGVALSTWCVTLR